MKTKKCIRKSSEPVTVSVVSFLICYVSVVLNDLFPFFFLKGRDGYVVEYS